MIIIYHENYKLSRKKLKKIRKKSEQKEDTIFSAIRPGMVSFNRCLFFKIIGSLINTGGNMFRRICFTVIFLGAAALGCFAQTAALRDYVGMISQNFHPDIVDYLRGAGYGTA
jgi:hypothetical protein